MNSSHSIKLGTRVAISVTARNLGVVISHELSLAAHVTAVCRSSYNQLCQLRPVVRLLSANVTKMFVPAFILCRLDYCNSLLYGFSDGLLPQSVQNSAAHLVTGTCCGDHIAPVLRQLHWLPVSPSASRVQDHGARASVACWSCSRVSC